MNRVLLVSMSRSGTNYFLAQHRQYLESIDTEFKIIDGELLQYHHFITNDETHGYLKRQLIPYLNKFGFVWETLTLDNIREIVLHILKTSKSYIFKYDLATFAEIIDPATMTDLINERNIKVVFLYRKNIINKVISHLIIDNFGYLETPAKINYANFKIRNSPIKTALSSYTVFVDGYKYFSKFPNTTLLVYENFKFDGNDLNHIGIDYKTNITTNKISGDRIVNKILKLDPTLITKINSMIDNEFHIKHNNFEFDLEQTLLTYIK